jgi:hypothetical protein
MNCPEGEIGGLRAGSQNRWPTGTSVNVLPPSLERDSQVWMKKLLGSLRRSKYEMSSWPLSVIAIHGWNWSALPLSWLTRTGPV